jgi:hypothetical protein
MSDQNTLLITQLLLELALKMQTAVQLFNQAHAEGRDVTDAEVDASGLRADVELEKLRQKIEGK